jgi:integrase
VDSKKTKHTGVYARQSKERRHAGRADVCYYITYKRGGKKVWEKVGWSSEGYSVALAAEIRAERMRDMRHRDEVPLQTRKQTSITLDQAWAKYKHEWLQPTSKNPAPDINRYEKHIRHRLGHVPLKQITVYDLQRFENQLTGLSPQTVKHVLSLIKRIYNRAIAWELYAGRNPAQGIQMPRVDNERWRWLTVEESHRLLEELARRSQVLHDMALLSLHTGMRAGEIFALQASHLDVEHGLIMVMDPKHVSRTAYMTEEVRAMLRRRNPGSLVFPSRSGKRRVEVSNAFARAVDALGLNAGVADRRGRIVFHTLRHTFGSWLAMGGYPLYLIGELMGHSTYEMARRYSHLCPDQKIQAIQHIQATFARSSA